MASHASASPAIENSALDAQASSEDAVSTAPAIAEVRGCRGENEAF